MSRVQSPSPTPIFTHFMSHASPTQDSSTEPPCEVACDRLTLAHLLEGPPVSAKRASRDFSMNPCKRLYSIPHTARALATTVAKSSSLEKTAVIPQESAFFSVFMLQSAVSM